MIFLQVMFKTTDIRLALIFFAMILSSCAKNPVSGMPDFVTITTRNLDFSIQVLVWETTRLDKPGFHNFRDEPLVGNLHP